MIIKGTNITIPDSLIVPGNLILNDTDLTILPDGLTVGGLLDLSNTKIDKLPSGLTVKGWLDLSNTKISLLPSDLNVRGWLCLLNTDITMLPDGFNNRIFSYTKYSAMEETQLGLIKKCKYNMDILKDPTEKAKRLHNMLWVI